MAIFISLVSEQGCYIPNIIAWYRIKKKSKQFVKLRGGNKGKEKERVK